MYTASSFIAQAGVDPYVKADEVLSARPGEVSALGEAFIATADSMSSAEGDANLAANMADASSAFDGSTPTDLMAEVQAVKAALAATPQQLYDIGAPLCELATKISTTQQVVCDILAAMEEHCVTLGQSCEYAEAQGPTFGAAPLQSAIAAGVEYVLGVYTKVAAQVDEYDAFASTVLMKLQAAGYIIPPEVDTGITNTVEYAPPLDGNFMPTGTPEENAQWWAALPPETRAYYIQYWPELLASVSGLPAEVYDIVNRRGLADQDAEVRPALDAAAEEVWTWIKDNPAVQDLFGVYSAEDVANMSQEEIDELVATYSGTELNDAVLALSSAAAAVVMVTKAEQALTPSSEDDERYALEYDPDAYDGDGNIVIAIGGNPDTADNVAVSVQGTTHGGDTIDKQTATGEAIQDSMDDADPNADNVVIVYGGYDNPSPAEAPTPWQAQDGGENLTADLASWDASHQWASGADAHVTVIGHSYGTLVAGYAMQDGAHEYVDDVVLYGSPGTGADDVSDFGISGDHVFVATDHDDFMWNLNNFLESLNDGPTYYGTDPTNPEFGATEVATDGVGGHGDYFKPGTDTLESAGEIATGKYDLVEHWGS